MTARREHDPVRAFLEGAVAARTVPSAAWRVESQKGVVTAGVLGFATLEPGPEPATEDTPYDLASLTKPLATALLSVLLEEEGRLRLGEPALALLPELGESPYHAASLLDLAAHRAGLPAWRPLYLHAANVAAYLVRIATEPPAAATGATLYSDLGYVLLGAAVERASGLTLDVLFEERIGQPLGLRSTAFAVRGRGLDHAAATERGNEHERRLAGEAGLGFPWRADLIRGEVHDANAWRLGGVVGHAGLFGTAPEVAAIAREILSPSRLPLGARGRERLLTPVAGPGTRTCGFAPARDFPSIAEVLPEGAVGHMGFTGTSLWLDPGHRRLFVLLTNRVHPKVEGEGIHEVRREFHRLAVDLCERAGPAGVP